MLPVDPSMLFVVGQAPNRTGAPSEVLMGSARKRLAPLLGIDDVAWSAIGRANVFEAFPGKNGKGGRFPLDIARDRARAMLPRLDGKVVLVLGKNVARAFGLPPAFLAWHDRPGLAAAVIPHPSGINLWWNSRENREALAEFLGGVVDLRYLKST